jgi:hypothetical protein
MFRPVFKRNPEDQVGVKIYTPEEIKQFCEHNDRYDYDLETINQFRKEKEEKKEEEK